MVSAHHIKPVLSMDEFGHHLVSIVNLSLLGKSKPKTMINHSHLTPLQNQILNIASNNDSDVRGTGVEVFVNGLRGVCNEDQIRFTKLI